MQKHSILKRVGMLCAAVVSCVAAEAQNPFLPLWEFIPDGEPYVFEDPDRPGQYRVYLYGSHDTAITEYCGREQVVWSAPVDDLNRWRYDGVIFESKCDAEGRPLHAGGVGDVLYAPDVALVTGADGRKTYYLYPNNQNGKRNGMVARSDRPDGPFTVCNWSRKDPAAVEGVLGFDPAVFVDDDGRVYGYWGFEESWGAELDPRTMATVKEGCQPIRLVTSRKEEGIARFFEASSMRKIGDKYVLIYSRWTADGEFGLGDSNYTLAYAYGDHPLGPFTYGGTLIDARGRDRDAEGRPIFTATPSGNTHGSLCEIGGRWYLFYHRQTGVNEFSRQAMVAPVEVSVDPGRGGRVTITEGEYTSEGFCTGGLDLLRRYPAAIACYYTGPVPAVHSWPVKSFSGPYIHPTYPEVDPRKAPSDVALRVAPVVNCTNGSVLGYKYFNFDTARGADALRLSVELLPLGVDGRVALWVGAPDEARGGVKVGEFALYRSDARMVQRKYATVNGLGRWHGKQPAFFVFASDTEGQPMCEIYNFGFDLSWDFPCYHE